MHNCLVVWDDVWDAWDGTLPCMHSTSIKGPRLYVLGF